MAQKGTRSAMKAIKRLSLILLLTVAALWIGSGCLQAAFTAVGLPPGDAVRGKTYYENTCAGCHSVDQDRIGPRHRDVVERRIAAVAGFEYSDALKKLKGVWSEALLDEWLTDPQAVAPGTTMGFRVDDAQDRADVIAYLKTVSRRRAKRPVTRRREDD